MSSPGEELAVHLGRTRIGTLAHPAPRRYAFAYETSVVEAYGDLPLLSVSLPVRAGGYGNEAAKPYFEGLLPEGEVRKAVETRFQVPPGDGFRLLAEIGRDCAGAVVIVPLDGEPPTNELRRVDWLTEAELERELDRLPAVPLGIEVDGPRLSLGGVQDKLPVVRASNGRIGRPVGGAPSTHILKPGHDRYPEVAVNEAYCLAVARLSGLSTARAELISVGDRPVLSVERFDRRLDGERVERLHQEDMCQALGFLPERKYESEGGPGLSDIVEALRNASTAVASDVTAFLLAAATNVVLGNSDAHAKNYAFLYESFAQPRLAPLYDVVCTQVYPLVQRLAMTVGGIDDPEFVDRGAIEQAARDCELNPSLLLRAVDRHMTRLLSAVREVRERSLSDGWHAPVVDRIAEIASRRAAQLAAARTSIRLPVAPPSEVPLDTRILSGRVYPYTYNPAVNSAERALAVRSAYLVEIAGPLGDIRLGTSEQDAFERAVADSSLERYALAATDPAPRPPWRATDPTRSSVITVRRPGVPLRSPGWSLDERASVATNFRNAGPGPTLLFVADIVVRPTADADETPPLAARALFSGFWALAEALTVEVAPAMVRALPGGPAFVPLAFDALLFASGSPLGDYVRFELGGASRAEGSYDVSGGEWPVESLRSLQDRDRRAATIREWIGSVLRESGWKAYEPALEELAPEP